MDLEKYVQYRETKLHEQPGFAYNTYLCTIPQDFVRVGLHWHDQMEFIYIKKGSGTVSINLRPCHVEAGYIVPVLPGELHSIDGDPGVRMEYENIIFSLEVLDCQEQSDWCRTNVIDELRQGRLTPPRPICPGTAVHDELSAALDGADAASENMEPGYALIVKSCLFLCLHAMYRYRAQQTLSDPSRHTEQIKKLLGWVKTHFSEHISVQDAAQITGYSASHFMRIFRQETGQTFNVFLTEYRITASTYFLKETDDPISEIAMRCGFDNFSYFIRCFRKRYGLSPREYRRRQRTGQNVISFDT